MEGLQLSGRFVFLCGRLAPNLLGVITTCVLTRLLPPAEYGLYALGLTIVLFLTMGAFEWLGLTLLRMAPGHQQPELFFGTLVSCLYFISLIAVGIAVILTATLNFHDYIFLIVACFLTTMSAAPFELKQRLQLVELRETDYFSAAVGRAALTAVLACAAAYFSGKAVVILAAMAVSYFVANVVVKEPRIRLMRPRFDLAIWREIITFGLPLLISTALACGLGGTIEKWVLQGFWGAHEVGMFAAAAAVAQIPILALAGGFGAFSYSLAVKTLAGGSPSVTAERLSQNFVVLAGVALPAAVGIILTSPNLARLMVGQAYWHSVVLLTPWLAGAAALSSIRSFYFDFAFQFARRTSWLIGTMLATVIGNVILDLLLIPQFHELGAAIGTFVTAVLGMVITVGASLRVYPLPVPVWDLLKICISTTAMAAVVYALSGHSGTLALGVEVLAGALTYVAGLLVFNLLDMRSWVLRELTRKVVRARGL